MITVGDGKSLNNELDVVEGMQFDAATCRPTTPSTTRKQVALLDSPFVLLFDKKISVSATCCPPEAVAKAGRPLLIIAEGRRAKPWRPWW